MTGLSLTDDAAAATVDVVNTVYGLTIRLIGYEAAVADNFFGLSNWREREAA